MAKKKKEPKYYKVLPHAIQACIEINKKQYTKCFKFSKYSMEEAKKLATQHSLNVLKELTENSPPLANRALPNSNKRTTGIRGVYRRVHVEKRISRNENEYLVYQVSMKKRDGTPTTKVFHVGNVNNIDPIDDLHGYIMAAKFRAVYLLCKETGSHVTTEFYRGWRRNKLWAFPIHTLFDLSTT